MMDTSKEYILQCEKAVEIQESCDPIEGDYIYDKQGKDLGINVYVGTPVVVVGSKVIKTEFDRFLLANKTNKHLFVWLPRQDRLQEMVDKNPQYLVEELSFEIDNWGEYYGMFRTMEQLWLAFVMSELYSKQWTGEYWKETTDER